MSKELEKKYGTPNQKSLYQRLGIALEELQTQPFYKGKALEMSKLAHQMSKVYALEMERGIYEKEVSKVDYVINLENKAMAIEPLQSGD